MLISEAFFYSKKKAALWLAVGLLASAISVWTIATGRDFFGMSGLAAQGAVSVLLVLSVVVTLALFPRRMLFDVLLISTDAEGLFVRNSSLRMKRVNWDQIRWIEHPLGPVSTFRIWSTVGSFSVYHMSNKDRIRLFRIFDRHEIAIGTSKPPPNDQA